MDIFPLEHVYFWDKPYQEISFKNHSSNVLFFKLGKMLSD